MAPKSPNTNPQTNAVQDSFDVELKPCIRSGAWTDQGERQSMEDEHVLVDDLVSHLGPLLQWKGSGSYYGIFDGHDGRNAALFVKEQLLNYIVRDVAFPCAIEEAVHHAFLQTDAAFAEACSVNKDLSSGTTAITVLILGRELIVANAGDCRAVLCRKGKAISMSRDHKPDSLEERIRIEALGGTVYDGYLNGYLSVARAFGNWHIEGLKGVNCPLSAEPEVKRLLLTEDDEFLIIGCDGIWDVFTNENAINFARKELQRHNDPVQCSRQLVDEALHRNSTDNLTVVTVCFQTKPPPELFKRFIVRGDTRTNGA